MQISDVPQFPNTKPVLILIPLKELRCTQDGTNGTTVGATPGPRQDIGPVFQRYVQRDLSVRTVH